MPVLTNQQVSYLRGLFSIGTDEVHEVPGFSGATVVLPAHPATGRRLDVFANGVLLRTPAHYTVVADQVVFTAPALSEVDVVVKYVAGA
jgi:hypothetical protein